MKFKKTPQLFKVVVHNINDETVDYSARDRTCAIPKTEWRAVAKKRAQKMDAKNERAAKKHRFACALCGAFIPLFREGEKTVTCKRCGTVWQ